MAADGFHPSRNLPNMGAGSGGQNPPEILNSPLLAENCLSVTYFAENRPANLNAFEPAMTDTEHSAAEAIIETHPWRHFARQWRKMLRLPPPTRWKMDFTI
jgi:hypothetical protein